MPCAVTWDEHALNDVARLMDADPGGLELLCTRMDELADDPRPTGATAWGRSTARLRIGQYRVLYRSDDLSETVDVVRVGRAH